MEYEHNMVQGTLISILILLSSLIILFFTYRIVTYECGGFRLDNVVFFFMICYVVYAFIGSVLFNVFYLPHGRQYHIYETPGYLTTTWIIVAFGMFFIPLSQKVFTRNKLQSVSYSLRNTDSHLEKLLLYFIFAFCCFILFSYSKKIGGIPLIRYLKDRSLSQAFLRSEATNNFSGHAWRYVLFYETIPKVLLILTCFSSYKRFRNILFIYNCFIAVMTFQKGPLINLFLLLLIIYARKKGKLSKKVIFFVGILCILLILLMYIFFMNAKGSIVSILEGAAGRIFLGQILCFPWFMKYADYFGFIGGTSFPNPHGIFPFEVNRITVNVMKFYKDSYQIDSQGVVGSMLTVFPAEWYVNFGWIGIIISFILFAFIMFFVIRFCNKQIRIYHDKYAEALFVYLIFYMSKFASTSFTGIIIDETWIIPVLLLLGFRKVRSSFNYLKYRRGA